MILKTGDLLWYKGSTSTLRKIPVLVISIDGVWVHRTSYIDDPDGGIIKDLGELINFDLLSTAEESVKLHKFFAPQVVASAQKILREGSEHPPMVLDIV